MTETPGTYPAGEPQPPAYGQQPYGAMPPPAPGYGYGAPAGAPPGSHVDPASGLVLPDGVELASHNRRIGAYFLAIPLAIVTLGIGYVIWGLIVWTKGTTPALQVLGMKVWSVEGGGKASFGKMALREIIGRFVEGILSIITEIISLVMFFKDPMRRSLHDRIASTTVVYDPNKVIA